MERHQYPLHRAAQINNASHQNQPIKQNPNYNPSQPGQPHKSGGQAAERGRGEQGRK